MLEQNFWTFLASSGATGLAIAWVLQLMKQSNMRIFNWIGITPDKAKWNFAVAAAMSAIGALGVHTDYGITATGFHIAMSGTWTAIAHGIGTYLWQLLNTHGAYKLVVVPPEIQAETRDLAKKIVILLEKQALKDQLDKFNTQTETGKAGGTP